MKLFGPLYDRALAWSRHPKAPLHLTLLSFIEAIIFPVAPEVMLAPMCLAQPKRGFYFATLSLVGSILVRIQYYMLDAATQRVFSDAVTLTETRVTPALERQHDG